MDGSKSYHHGDLRAALLMAAEQELDATGIEGFSLRKVAKRAGVSHAAPAHHFGDVRGLLTALAALGFERLVRMGEAEAAALGEDDPRGRALAYGLAYAEFAARHTALFRLCFSSGRPDFEDAALKEASDGAFLRLAGLVAEMNGRPLEFSALGLAHAYAVWAVTHGAADLLASGKMDHLASLDKATRAAAIRALIAPALDTPPDLVAGGSAGHGTAAR
ncbi:MAG: TetR/AcrR family transcriptional regulator [Pseudomonadota bacterium]